eukprot:m.43439 g.43439  ORF g.43439 m.43439 type:complete len:169 (-) comp12038_c0_seq1:21-527(-)
MLSKRDTLFAQSSPILTLCFQKEVAERLYAPAQTRQRGRLSVMTQMYMATRSAFLIPNKAFIPAPKVQAMVVSCQPRAEQRPGLDQLTFEELEAFIRTGFGSRHRRLRHTLRGLPHIQSLEAADAFLAEQGFQAETRPMNLSEDAWLKLALAYKQLSNVKNDLCLVNN